ncbi:hypothetical protein V8C86DRAFT_990799 [Haematococcus lacustris]
MATATCSGCRAVVYLGTSMSCPLVAGAATLVRQHFTDGYYPLVRIAGLGFRGRTDAELTIWTPCVEPTTCYDWSWKDALRRHKTPFITIRSHCHPLPPSQLPR